MTITTTPTRPAPGDARRSAAAVLDRAVATARDLGRDYVAASLARYSRLLDPGPGCSSSVTTSRARAAWSAPSSAPTSAPSTRTSRRPCRRWCRHAEEPSTVLVGPQGRQNVTTARLAGAVTGRDEDAAEASCCRRRSAGRARCSRGADADRHPRAAGRRCARGGVLAELPAADAVILVSDASRELARARSSCCGPRRRTSRPCSSPSHASISTPPGGSPRPRRHVARRARLAVDVVGVSAELYRHTRAREYAEL